jgi:hypothetical protein
MTKRGEFEANGQRTNPFVRLLLCFPRTQALQLVVLGESEDIVARLWRENVFDWDVLESWNAQGVLVVPPPVPWNGTVVILSGIPEAAPLVQVAF